MSAYGDELVSSGKENVELIPTGRPCRVFTRPDNPDLWKPVHIVQFNLDTKAVQEVSSPPLKDEEKIKLEVWEESKWYLSEWSKWQILCAIFMTMDGFIGSLY